MKGQCFCGAVEFEITGNNFKLYQCHCSQCRRQSGSSANAATIVPASAFRWIRGTDSISSWTHQSGFRSDFCSVCGSPAPNPLKNLPYFWTPAGLLDDSDKLEVIAHLCVASKASWDMTDFQGKCFEHLPDLQEFLALLQSHQA